MGIQADIQKLEVDTPIILHKLDFTLQGGDVLYWHNMQVVGASIVFAGETYVARPISVDGIEVNGSTKPRPRLTVSNVEQLISAIILGYDDLIGAVYTRTRTLKKYLDGEPLADPTATLPVDVFYVIQKETEQNKGAVIWVLGDPSDLPGVTAPQRRFLANLCGTEYRGEVCQYGGDPLQELDGTPITGPFVNRFLWSSTTSYNTGDVVTVFSPEGTPHVFVARSPNTGVPVTTAAVWAADRCNKRQTRCQATFGAGNPINFDAHPSISRIPA